MRQPGYYWIKLTGDSDWEVAEWTGQVWSCIGDDYDEVYLDDDIYQKENEKIKHDN